MFHHPSFDYEQAQNLPGFALNTVLRLPSPNAYAWKTALSCCCERLKDIEFYMSLKGASQPATAADIPHFNKMLIKPPILELACFIFAAADAELIHSDAKQQLNRLCCGFFSTDKAPEISPKSFRNHFDNPTTETLKETKNNLHLMIATVNNRLQALLGALFRAISWSFSMLLSVPGDLFQWETAGLFF